MHTAKASITSGTADGALVAAVTGKKIRVHGLILFGATSVTAVTFNTKPGGAGTAILGPIGSAASGGFVLPLSGQPYAETNSGEGLSATVAGSGGTQQIMVYYELVNG